MVKKLLLCLLTPLFAVAVVACGSEKAAAPKATPTITPLPAIYTATITPMTGPPGTEVTISGTNWPPGLPITITTLNAGPADKPYFTGPASDTGTFKATFRIEKTPSGEELKQGRLDLNIASLKGGTSIAFQVEAPRPVRQPGSGG